MRGNGFMGGGELAIEGGSVVLDGATAIRRNEGGWGGGVLVDASGSLVMHDSSAITRTM